MNATPRRPSQYGEAAALVRQTKDVQSEVISALSRHVELTAKMREFEDIFGAHVLNTAAELYLVREKRKHLDKEYRRIRQKVDQGGYDSAEEIQAEVDEALQLPDVTILSPDTSAHTESNGHNDEALDAATKARIVRTFKRVVLPNVHSDTSDAEYSEFELAFSAYNSRDYTLMEAFIIQYRGEIGLEEDGNLLTMMQLTTRLNEYRAARKRLNSRLHSLEQDATPVELNAPEQARKRMEEQSEKFRQAINEEGEKVRDLQGRLRSLADNAYEKD